MNWYHHLTILPLGKHVILSKIFFCLTHIREDLCLSGTNICIWNSTGVSLLSDLYNLNTTRVQLWQLGHSLNPKGEVHPVSLWRNNSFMNSWKYYFHLMILKNGIIPIWGVVYLWENVKEADPCLLYIKIWSLYRDGASFLSLSHQVNFKDVGKFWKRAFGSSRC